MELFVKIRGLPLGRLDQLRVHWRSKVSTTFQPSPWKILQDSRVLKRF